MLHNWRRGPKKEFLKTTIIASVVILLVTIVVAESKIPVVIRDIRKE